jgi:hypothetical protein
MDAREMLTTVIGCGVIVAALGGIAFLTFWSRQTIERIARSDSQTAREITKEFQGGG